LTKSFLLRHETGSRTTEQSCEAVQINRTTSDHQVACLGQGWRWRADLARRVWRLGHQK
jgi:hypothetical protein